MDDETFQVCPYCGKRIDPNAEGVVYARKQEDVPGFGQVHDHPLAWTP